MKRILTFLAVFSLILSSFGQGTTPTWDAVSNNFYANGTSITITDANTTPEATLITWESGSQEVPVNATVYGGSLDNQCATSNITMNGGKLYKLYGGGNNTSSVTLASASAAAVVTTNITISGGNVTGTVYGGGSRASVTNKANITVTGGTFFNIMAGSYGGSGNSFENQHFIAVKEAEMNISGGTFSGIWTAPQGYSILGDNNNHTATNLTLNFSGGTTQYLYSSGSNGYAYGKTIINLTGGTVVNDVCMVRGVVDELEINLNGTTITNNLYIGAKYPDADAAGNMNTGAIANKVTVNVLDGSVKDIVNGYQFTNLYKNKATNSHNNGGEFCYYNNGQPYCPEVFVNINANNVVQTPGSFVPGNDGYGSPNPSISIFKYLPAKATLDLRGYPIFNMTNTTGIVGPYYNNKEFYAQGTPITIADVPSVTDAAKITWGPTDSLRTLVLPFSISGSYPCVYGGSLNASCLTSNITMNGGKISALYGGGKNNVNPVTLASVSAAAVGTTNVTINGGTVKVSVFGGGRMASVTNKANITVTGGTFYNIMAGSYGGSGNSFENQHFIAVKEAEMNISGGTFSGIWTAPHGYSILGENNNHTATNLTLNFSGGTTQYLYSSGSNGYAYGKAVINLTGGTVVNDVCMVRGVVDELEINLDGTTITNNLYIGAKYPDANSAGDRNTGAIANKVTVNVLDGSVKDIVNGYQFTNLYKSKATTNHKNGGEFCYYNSGQPYCPEVFVNINANSVIQTPGSFVPGNDGYNSPNPSISIFKYLPVKSTLDLRHYPSIDMSSIGIVGGPYYNDKNFYAQGNPITISEFTSDAEAAKISWGPIDSLRTLVLPYSTSGKYPCVYGGSLNASCLTSNITMNGGKLYKLYGGGNNTVNPVTSESASAAAVGTTNVNINGGTVKSTVYGGGSMASVTTKANITVSGGTFNNIMAGSYGGSGNSFENQHFIAVKEAEMNISGGTFSGIWTAPHGYSILGENNNHTATNLTLNFSGGTTQYLYSSGSNGYAYGKTIINLTGGTVVNDVCMVRGVVDELEINLDGTTITNNLYIGAKYPDADDDVPGNMNTGAIANKVTVNVLDGSVKDIVNGYQFTNLYKSKATNSHNNGGEFCYYNNGQPYCPEVFVNINANNVIQNPGSFVPGNDGYGSPNPSISIFKYLPAKATLDLRGYPIYNMTNTTGIVGPYYNNKNFYAQGTPITIADVPSDAEAAKITWGPTDSLSTILLSFNTTGEYPFVYGGSLNASCNTSNITMNGGKIYLLHGGGLNTNTISQESANDAKVNTTQVFINGGTVSATVYGGGRKASVGESNLTITGGTLNDVMGGSNGGANSADHAGDIVVNSVNNISVTGGTIGRLYGGPQGHSTLGNSANTNDTVIKINIADAAQITSLFAAGSNGITYGTSKVNVTGGTIGNIAGMERGIINNVEINVSGGAVDYVYAGASMNSASLAESAGSRNTGVVKDTISINITGGSVKDIVQGYQMMQRYIDGAPTGYTGEFSYYDGDDIYEAYLTVVGEDLLTAKGTFGIDPIDTAKSIFAPSNTESYNGYTTRIEDDGDAVTEWFTDISASVEAQTDIADSVIVHLTKDVALDKTITIRNGKNVTLLDDYASLTRGDTLLNVPMIIIESGAVATIGAEGMADSLIFDGGSILTNNAPIIQNNGTLTIKDNVYLRNNFVQAGTYVGAIVNNGSASKLYIAGNTAIYNCKGTRGVAIYNNAGKMYMSNGLITNNTLTHQSGGNYGTIVTSGGIFSFTGGTIINNVIDNAVTNSMKATMRLVGKVNKIFMGDSIYMKDTIAIRHTNDYEQYISITNTLTKHSESDPIWVKVDTCGKQLLKGTEELILANYKKFALTNPDYVIDQMGYVRLRSALVAKNLQNNYIYTTLKQAVIDATSDNTIAMIGNDSIDSPIIIDKNINLIAEGGHRFISRKTNYSDTMFFVSDNIEFNVGNDNFTDTLFINGNNVNAVKPMINTEFGKIKIKKAVLQNAKSVNSVNSGGAVSSKSDVIVDGSIFRNNYSNAYGGAIDALGKVIADSCWFTDNYAGKSGGAISSYFSVELHKEARFENNRADDHGGAIYTIGKVIADSCWFTGNYANVRGGAIFSDSVLIKGNAYFENDTANNESGGAIYAYKNVQIEGNSTFTGNYANLEGGAIFSWRSVELHKEARFENNRADNGGAISSWYVIADTDSCWFIGNTAYTDGGAIDAGSVLIKGNAYFENDTAHDGSGGAIRAYEIVQIDGNSTFKGNYADTKGGAICSDILVEINNKARFENNRANDGGAIYANHNITLDNDIVFENNHAKFGDAIYLFDTLVISDANMFINDTIYLAAPYHTPEAAIELNTTTALSNIQLEFNLAYYAEVPYKVLLGSPDQLNTNHLSFIPDSAENYFINQEGYLTTHNIEVKIETRQDGSTPNWETRYNEIGVFFHDNDADGSIDSVSYPVAFSIEKASNLSLVADNQIWLTFAFNPVDTFIQYHVYNADNRTNLYVDAINSLPTPSVYDSTYIVSIPLSDIINSGDVIVNALNFDIEFENKWDIRTIPNPYNYFTSLNHLVGVASTPESPVAAARIAQGNHGASGVVFSATEGNGAISYNPADYSYWAPQTHVPQESVWVSVDVTRPADTIHNVYLNWKNRLDNLTTTEDLYTDTSFIDYFEIGANHNPAAKDYTFDTTSRSWGDSENGNYKIYWFDADTALQAIETITISRQAAPTYQVQFNYNEGGDACNTEPTYTDTTVIFGRPFERPEDPFKCGHLFMDWHNENNDLFPLTTEVDSFANVRADGDGTLAFGTRRDMVIHANWNYYLTLTNPLDTAVIANYGVCEIPTRDYVTNPPAYTYTYNEDYLGNTYLDYNETVSDGNGPCIDQNVDPFDYGTTIGLEFSDRISVDSVLAVGQTHTITWSIRDFCDSIHVTTQVVKVKFPPCGIDNFIPKIEEYDRDLNDYTSIAEPFEVEYDSYSYSTVRMGCDCWTAENLQNATDAVGNATEGKPYYHFTEDLSNTEENTAEYGLLYSWDAAMANTRMTISGYGALKTQGICPDGWYLPELTDWQLVIDANDMYALMSTDQSSYWLGTENATNSTGFGVKPAGFYNPTDQLFYNIYGEGYFWTSTHEGINATCIKLGYNCPIVMVEEHFKPTGYSIRCVKDSRIRVFPRPR